MSDLFITNSTHKFKNGWLIFEAHDGNNVLWNVEISKDEILYWVRFVNDDDEIIIKDSVFIYNEDDFSEYAQMILEATQKPNYQDNGGVIIRRAKVDTITFSKVIGKMQNFATFNLSQFFVDGELSMPFVRAFMNKNNFKKYKID